MLCPASNLQNTVLFWVSGVGFQVSDICRLAQWFIVKGCPNPESLLTPEHVTPETIDIVLFKELDWTKIYHTTFVTSLWDARLESLGLGALKFFFNYGQTFF